MADKPIDPDLLGPTGIYPKPEDMLRWLRQKPDVWKLHQERMHGKSAAQQELDDVIRSGANLRLLLPKHELPDARSRKEVLERTLSFTNPEYQKRFAFVKKIDGVPTPYQVDRRQRPIPLSRFAKQLTETLGPQYNYPSGGPTGTTRATTDRLQRKTAAEKLYEDLIENK